jgi:hypothetical protein
MEYTENRDMPMNNVYRVPILAVSFMECYEGSMQGCETTITLSEGRNEEFARENLRDYPDFGKNWNELTLEQKRINRPFWLDYIEMLKNVLIVIEDLKIVERIILVENLSGNWEILILKMVLMWNVGCVV